MSETQPGRVVHKSKNQVRVDTAEGVLVCSLRGRFRATGARRSPVVVGDRVLVTPTTVGEGVLEEILPRSSQLTRRTAGKKEVIVAANMERLIVVLSARDPGPRWSAADRVIAAAHSQGLEPGLVVNKWDLVRHDGEAAAEIAGRLAIYESLDYAVFPLSALDGDGLEPLRAWLRGRATVFAGHSGVGKSTLLNALDPAIAAQTGAVSTRTGKGKHTTTAVTLYSLPAGTYVADTPGFREFALWGLEPAEVGRYYSEFRAHIGRCRFGDCLHRGEPNCAVRAAVASGEISKFRYESYLQVVSELADG